MDVITTHINADFDALGSMVAAKKLYPDAVMVFPGSQEKSLRRFFLHSLLYAFSFEKARKIDLKKVRRLILVDIRQKDRIGPFAELVDAPGVELHVYDHHPPTDQDVRGTVEVYKPYGATVSLLVELIRERSLPLSPEDATILMLGIYEDTGSLLFSSTTVQDLEAAAFLLRCGADLRVVSDLITSELTQDQVIMLNELIQSRRAYDIHGIEVNISEASADGYVGDLAVLVHKLKDMENLDVLFVLARMENRVFLVARSRIREVDVGEFARFFGGGGHPTAASATIKDLTLFQVREKLLSRLGEVLKPLWGKTVRDYMSFPVKTVEKSDTVEQAAEVLNRFSISSLPILDEGRLCGIINRQTVEKAVYHGLQGEPVERFMTAHFQSLAPDDPMEKAQSALVSGGQRFLPVAEDGRIVGVLTRMDLVQSLSHAVRMPGEEPLPEEGTAAAEEREKRVTRLMQERLPRRVFQLLSELGEIAEELGMRVYLVGGVVRDLLLRRDNLDLDLVVEGEGIAFAEKLSERYQARIRTHQRFGTARVLFPEGYPIDIATARLEYYDKPAALPHVEWSSLKLDLYRRDFTINSLAIRLNSGSLGELVDFFGGQKDIKDKVVRVIQSMSFIEDPTRIFRALRFAERFGFRLGRQTKYLMQNAIRMGFPEQLDGRRLFSELKLILGEERPVAILERMHAFGLLRFIHPGLSLDARLRGMLERAREVCTWFRLLYLDVQWEEWIVLLLALMAFLNGDDFHQVCTRLDLRSGKVADRVREKGEADKVLRHFAASRSDPRPSQIYRRMAPLSIEALLFMMAKTGREATRKAVSLYITQLRNVKTSITGTDLRQLGYPSGPLYREILDKVLDARLNGEVTDRDSEIKWVRRRFPLKGSLRARHPAG
ncbi:MAG: CBS domain-containing protein [bacterium]